jgi:hypothetical protein
MAIFSVHPIFIYCRFPFPYDYAQITTVQLITNNSSIPGKLVTNRYSYSLSCLMLAQDTALVKLNNTGKSGKKAVIRITSVLKKW